MEGSDPSGFESAFYNHHSLTPLQVFPTVPRKRTNTAAVISPRRRLCCPIYRMCYPFVTWSLCTSPISNRAMLHDQEVYADPEEFNPDRFIPEGTKPAAPDPARAAFGFGRRYAIFLLLLFCRFAGLVECPS